MKTLALLIAIASIGCVSTETTVTAPDGTTTKTVTKGVDPASVAAATAVANALTPHIIADK